MKTLEYFLSRPACLFFVLQLLCLSQAKAESRSLVLGEGQTVEIIEFSDTQVNPPSECDEDSTPTTFGPVSIVFEGIGETGVAYRLEEGGAPSDYEQKTAITIAGAPQRPADLGFLEGDVPGRIRAAGPHLATIRFMGPDAGLSVERTFRYCYNVQPRPFDGFDYPLSRGSRPFRFGDEDGARFQEFPGLENAGEQFVGLEEENNVLRRYNENISGNGRYHSGEDYHFSDEELAVSTDGNIADLTGWWISQDIGSYYGAFLGLHSAEDWNFGSNDLGRRVYSIANGVVHSIRHANSSSKWIVFIEHDTPLGALCSGYLHINKPLHLAPGDVVERGEYVGTLAALGGGFTPHLHFEMRSWCPDPSGDIWPNDGGNGGLAYYRDKPQANALERLRADGLFDGSDCMDSFPVDPEYRPQVVTINTLNSAGQVEIGGFNFLKNGPPTVELQTYDEKGRTSELLTGDVLESSATRLRVGLPMDLRSLPMPARFTVRSGSISSGPDDGWYPFRDLQPKKWFTPHVMALTKLGIINGRSDSRGIACGNWSLDRRIFAPADEMSRAEFMKTVIFSLEKVGWEIPQSTGPGWIEYVEGQWYRDVLRKAYSFTNGDETLAFWDSCGESSSECLVFWSLPITRLEAAHVLLNALLKAPYTDQTRLYSDIQPASEAAGWVHPLTGMGIFRGFNDGEFKPDRHLSRAGASKIIFNSLPIMLFARIFENS